jgi:hypothetical protein
MDIPSRTVCLMFNLQDTKIGRDGQGKNKYAYWLDIFVFCGKLEVNVSLSSFIFFYALYIYCNE